VIDDVVARLLPIFILICIVLTLASIHVAGMLTFQSSFNFKEFRVRLADKLESWGKKHGLYAVPMISTVQIRRELLRTPLLTDKENHIKSVIRKFMPTQPTSIRIILEDIKNDFPVEYSIALPEYEAILDETFRHQIN